MPPDRTDKLSLGGGGGGTASSFSDAIARGQPLSSVGPGHAPSLERGRACLTCRRRRVKCDGARPVCGRCAKSAKAHGEDPTTIICEYDSSVPKRPPKDTDHERVSELAAEVAALKQQLLAQQQQQQQQAVVAAATAAASSAPLRPPHQPQQTSTSHAPSSFSNVASTSAVTLDSPAYPSQPQQQETTHFSFPSTSTGQAADASGGAASEAYDPATFFASAASPGPFATFASSSSSSFDGAGGANPLADLADLASSTLTNTNGGTTTTLSTSDNANTDAASFSLPSNLTFSLPLPDFTFSPSSSSAWSLLPASYPPTLPSPPLLNRLLTVYFTNSHLASLMINESRFRSSLLLPTGHAGRPLECLLHAVCATAGLMVGEGFLEGEGRYWLREGPDGGKVRGKGAAGFSEYHAKRAEELLQPSFAHGASLLQLTQACVLLCFCAYTAARFETIWSLSSRATRLAVLAGLHHLRPYRPDEPYAEGGGGGRGEGQSEKAAAENVNSGRTKARRLREPAMLPPPRDREEVQERLYTFWAVFMADRMTCAATDWALTLAEEDVTSLLPAGAEGGGVGDDEWFDSPLSSPLCIHNPSFFLANPPHLVGPHQLYIKAVVLLGRVCRFLQRAPDPVGSGYPLEEGRDLREEPTFRSLERTTTHFRQSIPRELQYSYVHLTTGRIDERLLLAHSTGHVVTILMHEPFCLSPTITVEDESFSKCLAAAKAIVTSVYEISGSSYEIGLLASFLNWVWAVAGRTLVRALALASRRSDLSAASHLAMDVKALIGAMEANKSAVGAVTASVLQRLLTDPFQVLPDSPPASSRNSKNFSSRHRSATTSSSSYPTPDNRSSSSATSSYTHSSSAFTNTTVSHPTPSSNVVYLSAFDPPYDGEQLTKPRARKGTSAAEEGVVPLSGSASGNGTGGGDGAMGFPGTIWEMVEDTPAGSGEALSDGALDEFARKVVEGAVAGVGAGEMEGGWS